MDSRIRKIEIWNTHNEKHTIVFFTNYSMACSCGPWNMYGVNPNLRENHTGLDQT